MTILTVGAGLGSLTLAHALHRSNIPFHVYERDSTPHSRSQGYRIRIDATGQRSLSQALPPHLFDLFKQTSPPARPGMKQFDALNGDEVPFRGGGPPPTAVTNGNAFQPVNADRAVLRGILLRGLERHVTFGKELACYNSTPASVTAHFADGTCAEGTLLIGADGSRSCVRRYLAPAFKIVDLRARCIYGKTLITPTLERNLSREVLGGGMCGIKDQSRDTPVATIAEPMRFSPDFCEWSLPRDYVYWVLAANEEHFPTAKDEIHRLAGEKAAEPSRRMAAAWHSTLSPLLEQQIPEGSACLPLMVASPDNKAWQTDARVTLLGDAAHVMPPTAGIGANTAMRDALSLAEVIVKEGLTRQGIAKYEADMLDNARRATMMSLGGARHIYGQRLLEDCRETRAVEFG